MVRHLAGDCRDVLPTVAAGSVQCVVTSPPYWGLRDYGVDGQLGLEATPEAYVAAMVGVFREVRRVLRDDGTLWLNMGDSYNTAGGVNGGGKHCEAETLRHHGLGHAPGLKAKDLVGIPWRLAFALQADGWFFRADIIWAKPNPMPESVTDRPTKAHEYVFLLTKSARYFYDADAVREPASESTRERWGDDPRRRRPNGTPTYGHIPGGNTCGVDATAGRNLRSVWTINPEPFPEAHFATFPAALASRCIQAGSSEKGCCAACGAPWGRDTVVEHYSSTYGDSRRADRPGSNDQQGRDRQVGAWAFAERMRKSVTTLGWQPSCACKAAVVPCTVLDPFGGSGTVGQVAEQLGRHSILIELSPAYGAMARRRTAQCGLFTQERSA